MYAFGIVGLGIVTGMQVAIGVVTNRWYWILLLISSITLAVVIWRRRRDRVLLPYGYRSSRRQNYYVGLLFVVFGHLGLMALLPSTRDLLGGPPYVPFAGAALAATVWFYALGALFLELDLFTWRRQQSSERGPHR